MEICTHIGANALIILALTSDWMAIFLGSVVIQFMGRISFSLYLIHELFTEWAIVDTYYFFVGKGVE
jgi:peptidoglycan/LPS O-acetylase OafA/YrhL